LLIKQTQNVTNFILMDIDKSETLKKFGKRFRYNRVIKGYTQEKLAFELGVEISQISRIERGLINTSVYLIYRAADVLEVPPSDFFSE